MSRPSVALGLLASLAAVAIVAVWVQRADEPRDPRSTTQLSARGQPRSVTPGNADSWNGPAPVGTINISNFPPATPGDSNPATAQPDVAAQQAPQPWPDAVLQDPDPRARRQALENWARRPDKSLDLVTAMMVDPDETIRERAQHIFEEAITRK